MQHAQAAKLTKGDTHGAARAAHLHWATDDKPGIRREVRGLPHYFLPSGREVKDEATLRRIRALVIPPAWTEVWICPDPRGHIQATGRDARGRKQYRYHAQWREVRDETKYHRILDFGRDLPAMRRRVRRDLAQPGLPRTKVLAAVVRLLETTFIRVGNEEYARENQHFGLTTLQDKHARFRGGSLEFKFRGKSGVDHAIALHDPKLARIVRQCQQLPGQELLQYVGPDGKVHDIKSDDVNAYLHEVSGKDYSAKDFRTWAGTVLAALALQEAGAAENKAAAKRNIVRAVKAVSHVLGNTPAVCKKCYVHPEVINAYLDGELVRELQGALRHAAKEREGKLRPAEKAVLALLRRRLARDERARRAA